MIMPYVFYKIDSYEDDSYEDDSYEDDSYEDDSYQKKNDSIFLFPIKKK